MEATTENCDYIVLYKYMTYEAFIATVESWSLKAAFPYDVNDPLENVIQKNKHLPPEILKDSPHGYIQPFFSFSRNMSSSAMWGQYAEWGRGICLVFAFPIRDDSIEWIAGEEPGIFNPLICNKEQAVPLLYQEERFKINYNAKSKKVKDSHYAVNRWLRNNIVVKGKDWEYESEVRIHTDYKNATHEKNGILSFEWPMRYLIGAITGPKCKRDWAYISKKIELCKSAFKKTHSDIKLYEKTVVVQAKPHDIKFEFVAPPFFDKVDSRLFSELIMSNPISGLNFTTPGYNKNWNEWIKKVYNKESKLLNNYNQKINFLIIKDLSTKITHNIEIDGLVHFLTHSIIFKNKEVIQNLDNLRERIESYFNKNIVVGCNDQSDNTIETSQLINKLSNTTLNNIVKLILDFHKERNLLIIGEVNNYDKSTKQDKKS